MQEASVDESVHRDVGLEPLKRRSLVRHVTVGVIALVAALYLILALSQRRPPLDALLLQDPDRVYFRYIGDDGQHELDSTKVAKVLSRAIPDGWRIPVYQMGFQGGYIGVQKSDERREYLLFFDHPWVCLDGETSWTILMTPDDHTRLMEFISDRVPLPPPFGSKARSEGSRGQKKSVTH